MADMDPSDTKELSSTAAIAGHPLHPLLVTFPIAFLIGAFLSDLAFFGSSDQFWARASVWLVGAGLLTGVLASVAGFIDFVGNSRIRSFTIVWFHFIGNAIALALTAVNLYLRVGGEVAGVTGLQLLLSLLVLLTFGVTGWLGGELVFRHRVGMMTEAQRENFKE